MPVIPRNHDPQNFEVVAGDSVDLRVPITDLSDGQPTDLSGATVKWRVNAATPVLLQSPAGVEIVDPATDGIIIIHVSAGDLTEVGTFAHQCEVTLGSSVFTVFEGVVRVKTDYVP